MMSINQKYTIFIISLSQTLILFASINLLFSSSLHGANAFQIQNQTLTEEIEDKFRIGLSLAMLDHVIQTGIRANEFEDVLVVGGDEMISHLCHMAQCSWLPQPEGTNGLNETVDLIFNSTVLEGFDGLLYLPADLPELGISDLNGMIIAKKIG